MTDHLGNLVGFSQHGFDDEKSFSSVLGNPLPSPRQGLSLLAHHDQKSILAIGGLPDMKTTLNDILELKPAKCQQNSVSDEFQCGQWSKKEKFHLGRFLQVAMWIPHSNNNKGMYTYCIVYVGYILVNFVL